jgi:hypothetical protein
VVIGNCMETSGCEKIDLRELMASPAVTPLRERLMFDVRLVSVARACLPPYATSQSHSGSYVLPSRLRGGRVLNVRLVSLVQNAHPTYGLQQLYWTSAFNRGDGGCNKEATN